TEDQTFWCCTGTGIEEYAKLTDSIYWRDDEGVYVNLFIASTLDWLEERFSLRQDTTFPEAEHTALTVVEGGRRPLTIRLRVPGWLRSSPLVRLNGKQLDASATPDSYLTLTRSWKAGDRVEMDLPMHLQVETMADDPRTQAFLYGPLVLAGDLGNDGLTDAHIVGPNLRVGAAGVEQHGSPLGPVNRTPPAPDIEIPTFRAAGPAPRPQIRPTDH